jgi:hypothetical protein
VAKGQEDGIEQNFLHAIPEIADPRERIRRQSVHLARDGEGGPAVRRGSYLMNAS